jgi:5-methylcytosine-specific restriction endonuclease McrA
MKKVNRERLDRRTKAYKRYMASEAWAERRLNALIAADYTCQRCEWTPLRGGQPTALGDVIAAPALHIHHRSYRHFGAEQPDELEVVCADCHRKEHAGRFIKPRGLRGGR